MKKNKIFIACDSTNIKKVKKIIKETKNNKLIVGYKFGFHGQPQISKNII